MRLTGPCVKLKPAVIDLFSRLHLIFYRSTDVSDKSMTASMLARFKIRAYPSYPVKRTFALFPSRTALLEYEAALAVEKEIERCLGESPEGWKPKGSGEKRASMSKEEREEEAERERQRKMTLLKEGLAIFEDAWKTWRRLVGQADVAEERKRAAGTADDDGPYRLTYYRKRFDSGWPLTRVAYKGAHILSRFHEYDREIEVLEALLAQSHYRRGKRGAWYDRLALVLMNHMGNDDEDAKKRARKRALKVCVRGLQDPWTHLSRFPRSMPP